MVLKHRACPPPRPVIHFFQKVQRSPTIANSCTQSLQSVNFGWKSKVPNNILLVYSPWSCASYDLELIHTGTAKIQSLYPSVMWRSNLDSQQIAGCRGCTQSWMRLSQHGLLHIPVSDQERALFLTFVVSNVKELETQFGSNKTHSIPL